MVYASNLPVVQEVFRIKQTESDSSISECIDLFGEYLENSQLSSVTKSGADVRYTLNSILNGENECYELEWLEEFDAALLLSKNDLLSKSTIEFIYLEGWNSPIMSDLKTGREIVATSCQWSTFFLGQFSSNEVFISSFRQFVTGLKESFGAQKIRNTSTLLSHLNSMLYPDSNVTPELPSHVGKNKRGASWSLVKAVISTILLDDHLFPDEECLFEKTEVDFYVWLLEMMKVDRTVPTTLVDTFIQGHRTASQKCAQLTEKEFDTKDTAERLRVLWSKLETALNDADLSSDLRIKSGPDRLSQDPSIFLPAENSQSLTSNRSTLDIQRDVSLNLGALSPFPDFTALPENILAWLSKTTSSTAPMRAKLQLMVASVEQWLFQIALNLEEYCERSELEVRFISNVESILVQHRTNCANLTPLLTGSNLMMVELRSLEVLCVWIAFCIVHSAATMEYPLLGRYDVALNSSELHHLVFSEKAPTDAALAVAVYLKSYERSALVIFSLSDQSGTFKMAEEYSLNSTIILPVWEAELKFARRKRNDNFELVEKNQRKARELRDVIAGHKKDLAAYERADEGPRYCYRTYHHRQIAEELAAIEKYEAELKIAMKSPPMVYQALPDNKSAAMIMLFFCYMPEYLRTLGRLTIMAQQMLLPRAPFDDSLSDEPFQATLKGSMFVDVTNQSSLWEYYSRNSNRKLSAEPNNLLLRYEGKIKTQTPKDVDSYATQHDGTWHPDDLKPVMSWTGGDYLPDQLVAGDYNPFEGLTHPAVRVAQTCFFTERLSDKASAMSWSMNVGHGSTIETTRGNRGPAELVSKPDFLSKPQYLMFCSLRSYPNIQLRKLIVVLMSDGLPLDCPDVLTLFKQTLYQIGEMDLSGDRSEEPVLSWKMDGAEAYQLINDELDRLVDQIRESPKNHTALHLVGELAVFVTEQLPSCRKITREISAITLDWAASVDTEIEALALGNCTDPKVVYEHRAKQFIFYCYSLLCHRTGQLTAKDAAQILKLTVLAQNVRTFEDRTTQEDEVRAFDMSVERAMAGLADKLHVALSQEDFSTALTAAVGVVIASLPVLQWTSIPGTLCCFQATDPDGRLLSLNAVSGMVLCDGLPPRRLPLSVTGDAMYARSFGNRDFEVTFSAGVFTASRPLSGCIYEFTPPRVGAGLIIRERHVDSTTILQLLDGGTSGKWKTELPQRLQDQFSHWYSVNHNSIILRPVSFLERSISFLIIGDFAAECRCFVIPANYKDHSMVQLLDMIKDQPQYFHRLVLNHSVGGIVRNIESPAFIETSITTEGYFIIFLPRYGLSFRMKNSGEVESLDHKGCYLARSQRLKGTLRNFNEYLILENAADQVLVLIPTGRVRMGRGCDTVATCSDEKSGSIRKCYTYIVNPRLQILEGSDIAAQLHLAALYAATATALPETRTRRTGDEVAARIVRECFVNRPLSSEEYEHLLNITDFCNRDPALILQCHDLFNSSTLLSALHPTHSLESIPLNVLAATQYKQSGKAACHRRMSLSRLEEMRLFHKLIPTKIHIRITAGCLGGYCSTEVGRNTVSDIENKLLLLVGEVSSQETTPAFPLQPGDCKIGKMIMDDLQISWSAYHNLPNRQLLRLDTVLSDCESILAKVSVKREEVEKHILSAIDSIPDSGWKSEVFKIQKNTNAVPSATLEDLMRIALTPDTVLTFNPFFSAAACEAIKADILLWLQLCVLEDKKNRIISLAGSQSGGNEMLIQELLTKRNWSVEKYPYWLVYEAANTLQIRPTQFDVAMFLINNEGAIVQLNMGEGKTRVILPMLILYWGSASQRCDGAVRLHFLRQLLFEGYAHLHRQLSRSVLECKLFLMPFNRDVQLDVATVKRMYQSVLTCRESGGCLIMAREHRQSLQLKTCELMLLKTSTSAETLVELQKLNGLTYLDMLDESDELLNVRNELVYAVGEPQSLPGGPRRWVAVEAVLHAINYDLAVKHILETPDLRVYGTAGHGNTSETFCKIRLLAGEALAAHKKPLQQAIAQSILDNPPHKMRWMKRESKENREKMLAFFCDPNFEDDHRHSEAWRENTDDLLSLRGLLAFGILIHCLQMRHRVNYGIKRIGGKKRSVVPFRASDVPSERSEFSHPDITIVLTMLSYYSDGLLQNQLTETFIFLFGLGDSEKKATYNDWLGLSRGSMSDEDVKRIDDVSKVDHTNPGQFSLLYEHFRHNMHVVNCWLTWCVFPTECMQYPHKLSANAWNLVENPTIASRGFSGTDDRKLVLPLQVRSMVVQESRATEAVPLSGTVGVLSATNGKMLYLLMKFAKYEHLEVDVNANSDVSSKPSWHAVIDRAQERDCIALFDAGALMVGVSNSEVAEYVLHTMSSRPNPLKAALFFNAQTDVDGWQIRDSERRVWPRHASPILESDCFVIFDESRCIGTDVKMPKTAKCMLTIGTGMCKDKLLQAAGRARMLGKGQTLLLLGMSDVTNKIRFKSSLTETQGVEPLHVLEWVLHNTINAVKEGMLVWADQGVRFCIAQGETGAKYALEDEVILLEDMYNGNLEAQVPAKAQQEGAFMQLKRRGGEALSDKMQSIFTDIGEHCKVLGSDYEMVLTKADGECERELEREVLKEKLVERQFDPKTPVREKNWRVDIVTKGSMADILREAQAEALGDVIKTLVHPSYLLGDIPWRGAAMECAVHCSCNFMKTITCDSGTYLQQHLRQVDAFLYFPAEKTALLLTERESNSVLERLWVAGQTASNVRLTHLTCCNLPCPVNAPSLQLSRLGCASFDEVRVDPTIRAQLHLFNGETMYDQETRLALSDLLTSKPAKIAALRIPELRGLQSMLSRSDLEEACVY